MKKLIVTSAAILFLGATAFVQKDFRPPFSKSALKELNFQVHGRYDRPVYKERLEKARLVSDLVDYFPVNWIDKYVAVEILTTCNGKAIGAVSANEKLTAEQENILKAADLSSDLIINVKYISKNWTTTDSIDRQINIKLTVIPETEAEYIGGQQQMTAYLKESAINKIPETIATRINSARILFTVNEKGEIEDAKMSKTSGDEKTDQLLLEAINKMSKWNPAENSKGIKVKQQFVFTVGNGGC